MKVHEWDKLAPGERTVCGKVLADIKAAHQYDLAAVRDLSKILASGQCKSCMRMRHSSGTSTEGEVKP